MNEQVLEYYRDKLSHLENKIRQGISLSDNELELYKVIKKQLKVNATKETQQKNIKISLPRSE